MDFFSPVFFGYFIVIIVLYYLLNPKFQGILLLLASGVFIASISGRFLFYALAFVIVNYAIFYLHEKNKEKKQIAQLIYVLGLLINIGSLVFFKYINFLIDTLNGILGIINIDDDPVNNLRIIIPLGISYFTFQGIGYLIQLHRGLEKFEQNIVVFSNYFLFFPKFLAGPIEQSKHFIPQLKEAKSFNKDNVVEGFKLLMWGAFKKLVIADRLAMVINGVYPNMIEMQGNVFLFTFILQPIQLYTDFSGYTDMALGIAKMMGLNLTDNFRRPFFSKSVTEFWQRWHISLSAWCNEFIFKRVTFKYRRWKLWAPVYAVFLTFLVIGVWHGPRWNFIILGLLQGVAINYEFFTKRWRFKMGNKLPERLTTYGSYLLVYLFFCFTLIFFNAVEVKDSIYFITHIFKDASLTDFSLSFLSNFDKAIVLFSFGIVLLVDFRKERGHDVFDEIRYWPKWQRLAVYYVICILIIYMGSPDQEFVYMQF